MMTTVNVRYMVDDVEAAIAFYTTRLGFTVISKTLPAFADVARGDLRLLPGPGRRPSGIGRPAELVGPLHGLKIAAVAVVANAVWGMARSLAPDRERATVAILSAIVVLAWPGAPGQVLVIAVAGLIGWRLLAGSSDERRVSLPTAIRRRTAVASLVVFFALLGALPLLRQVVMHQAFVVFDSFFRVGALVFGGGHVVLPLLQAEVVPPGWVTNEEFVTGYGAPQGAALLERPPSARRCPGGAPGHQCGSRGLAPRCALSPRVDERDQNVG